MDITLIDFWHWWIAAILLLILETALPGFFFLWLAVAAVVVGIIMLAVTDLSWDFQLIWFSLLSVISIVAFRSYQKRHPQTSDQPTLNRRGEQYSGRTFTLESPIQDGVGKLKIDDTIWRIRGQDLPSGTTVKIEGFEGNSLLVYRLDSKESASGDEL